jgi:Uma2 family endonuclease
VFAWQGEAMTALVPATDPLLVEPPDHLSLPCTDGSIVNNSQEHPQSSLLSDTLFPVLEKLFPGLRFFVGCDVGIYWKWTQPPLAGCKSPDWFLVSNVPSMLDGQMRRSYVLWREGVRPLLLIEYVSGDGSEEHDTTPETGKFWVYEQAICAAYYVIFDVAKESIEVYRLDGGKYQLTSANAAGRFPIPPLGIELGLWRGTYQGLTAPWVRPWDAATGKMLPLSAERAEVAEQAIDETRKLLNEEVERSNETRRLLNEEMERSKRLADKLRALGIDPDA